MLNTLKHFTWDIWTRSQLFSNKFACIVRNETVDDEYK